MTRYPQTLPTATDKYLDLLFANMRGAICGIACDLAKCRRPNGVLRVGRDEVRQALRLVSVALSGNPEVVTKDIENEHVRHVLTELKRRFESDEDWDRFST